MKHILNNLTEQEKNTIREQHVGGMVVASDKFSRLLYSKLGDVKPINEDVSVGPGGLEFNDEYEDETYGIEPGDIVQFKKYGVVYVVSIMGDGFLVSDDEDQRYMGDNGDGYIIPFKAGKKAIIIEKG